MKKKKYAIVATFLEEEDYAEPEKYDINNRKTRTFPGTLDIDQIEDDIKTVTDWYNKYTKSAVSPKFRDNIDADLVDYLRCHNEEEWNQLLNKWKEEGKVNII